MGANNLEVKKMTLAETLFAVLTEHQLDRLIDLISKVVNGILAAVAVILPSLVLYFQKRNAKALIEKINESAEASTAALDVANGHNQKIAVLTEIIANSAIPKK
jgi:O-methyltransferase involved in polyketide biosynthesis